MHRNFNRRVGQLGGQFGEKGPLAIAKKLANSRGKSSFGFSGAVLSLEVPQVRSALKLSGGKAAPGTKIREARGPSVASTRPNKLVRFTGETGRSPMNDTRSGVSRQTSFQRPWCRCRREGKKRNGTSGSRVCWRKNNVAIFLYRKSSDRDVLERGSRASRGRIAEKRGQ